MNVKPFLIALLLLVLSVEASPPSTRCSATETQKYSCRTFKYSPRNTYKYLEGYFYNSDAWLTLAFAKNLCFSSSAAVGLNRKRNRAPHHIHYTMVESNGKQEQNKPTLGTRCGNLLTFSLDLSVNTGRASS